jgi:tetratricopeptide (TPR) repeat protein
MNCSASVGGWFRTAAAIILFELMFAGCAGTPVETEKQAAGPDPALMENARALTEKGAPEHLREALELLRKPASRFPEAEQQAAFTRTLFELLYPELAGSGYLPAPGGVAAYDGPYAGALERARSGRPPADGATAAGGDFFDLVVPALFLCRLGAAETAGRIPGLSAYRRLLERAEAQNHASVLPPYLLGRMDELEGRSEQAASWYEDSVERAASFYPGRQRLASLLLNAGQAEKAADLLERNVDLLPEVLSIRYDLAEAYYRSGHEQEAAEEAARILMQEPDHPEAMLLRSRILAAEGNWSHALRLLNLLLSQHPDMQEAYKLAARLRYEKARSPEDALELLEQAEQRFPNEALFPEMAGRIYLETGRSAEGLNELHRALDLEPGRISTLRLLLTNAMSMRRWLQAATYLSEILEQEQSEADLLQAIEIYGSLGDPAQALHFAEQLYAASPTVENLTIYARALIEAGRNETAAALVEEGLGQAESLPLHSTLLALKASLAAEQSPEEAMALLREALLEHPGNFDALVRIADLYVQQRELRRASLYLKQALALQPHNSSVRARLRNIEEELSDLDTP